MTEERSRGSEESATRDWPTYTLTCTFNPATVDADRQLEPDEVYVYDPTDPTDAGEENWISAKRGAYLPLEEIR